MTTIFNTQHTLHTIKNKRFSLIIFLIFILNTLLTGNFDIISPLARGFGGLEPLKEAKSQKEVFGFAPYWTINKLENVDFNVLTTLAYFGVPVKGDGSLDTEYQGYQTFESDTATQLFQKAHQHGTRVVLTITQMENSEIKALLDDPVAQERSIRETVDLVQRRGIDGVNIDLEYTGNPGSRYKALYSQYVKNMTDAMHAENPHAKVTVSVYASAVKLRMLYDVAQISENSDGIFMMAYDFAVASSDNAIPTAPLYGHKEGKYWYDVSTAVEDFLVHMPAEKLILGVPWYGYNYNVGSPAVKATTGYGRGFAQTYTLVDRHISQDMPGIYEYVSGWDEAGQVGWKAYYSANSGTWRMVFIDDVKSLDLKFEFAKQKNLGGVGMWALGFDDGKKDFWALLNRKFGTKYADASVVNKRIGNL
ncbi:MAG TPA: glycoside hydrolase family 18 protein [Candidatus Levybacteria bacterium]|nr:glycoside hydrolase family 18 protein [Candidatus Levybacteria bacterium]